VVLYGPKERNPTEIIELRVKWSSVFTVREIVCYGCLFMNTNSVIGFWSHERFNINDP
jgi:hypothetical protein